MYLYLMSFFQDVADVNIFVQHNNNLRKCVDIILTKVRENCLFKLKMSPLWFFGLCLQQGIISNFSALRGIKRR